jgi:hypothetical protein
MKALRTFLMLASFLLVSAAAAACGAPPLLAVGGTAIAGVVIQSMQLTPGGLYITITSSSIIQEAQTYFANRGTTEDTIIQTVKDKRDLPAVATQRISQSDLIEISNAEITDVIQTFKKNFSPKGTQTFTPLPIRLRRIKIDLTIDPDDIVETYFGFLSGLPMAERASWPVVRYIWEQLVAPKWGQNMSLCDWAGEHVTATNDTVAGPTLGSYDGLKTIITDNLDGGTPTMNELTLTNSLTNPAQVFGAFEEAFDALDQAYQREDMVVLCSPKAATLYFRDRRNTHGQNTDYKGDINNLFIDGHPNVKIQPLNGMGRNGDHDWLVITPKRNLINGKRLNAEGGYNFRMEEDHRTVDIMADWKEAVGFGLAQEVFVARPEASGSGS